MITGGELKVAANWKKKNQIISKYMKPSHLIFKVQGKVTPLH